MKIIGLCGGSGSGKGVACNYFAQLGIPSIDTDAVYHEITHRNSACVDELVSAFGDNIIDSLGGVNRKILAQIVFGDNSKQRLGLLNEITHRHILSKTREIVREYELSGVSAVIVDAPLLFESGFNKECDFTVAVIADREIRIKRIVQRDNIGRDAAIKRIDSQISNDELTRCCDFVIENNGDVDTLKKAVLDVASKILNNKYE